MSSHRSYQLLYMTDLIVWQVRIPLNVLDSHWLVLNLNFDKEEIQVPNSSQAYRDEAKETALVSVIFMPLSMQCKISGY